MSLFRDKKKTMSDAAAPAAAEAAVVVVLSPRRAKRLRVRSADFARLRAGPAKVTARQKESIVGKELDRLKSGTPVMPVISPSRRITRQIAGFKNGAQIAGAAVEGWNSVKGQWVPGTVVSSSIRRPRGAPPGAAGATAHVLVVVRHLDGCKRAYMVECLRRGPV